MTSSLSKLMPISITFVTGNQNKLREVQKILGDSINLVPVQIDLPELQGEMDDISIEKCKIAAKHVKGPVIIDDTSLCFNALGGLPGPYIKWFLEKIGNEGLNRMLDGFVDRTGTAVCTFAFCRDENSEPILFKGRVKGSIVRPRGSTNFGWDPIFQPDGCSQTYAEMDSETKNKISHRCLALNALREFLTSSVVE